MPGESSGADRPKRWLALVGALVGVLVVAAGLAVVRTSTRAPACEPAVAHPEWSMARRWDEALLSAIRLALPAPTVHARNLFHTSVAMWDAWAAYDPRASGYLVQEKLTADDVEAARNEAISYAAYRVLSHRYAGAAGGTDSLIGFNRLMDDLCYSIDVTTTEGDSPSALGNRISAAVIAYGLADGSNEAQGYASDYEPVNPPLVVAGSGTEMTDPSRWQPLQLEQSISQNGIPVEDAVQEFIGPHWGHVAGFALPGGGERGLPVDTGPPPVLGDPQMDAAFKQEAIDTIRASSQLDPKDGATIDIGPGAFGDSTLGTNDGDGHDLNPATGEPYPPNEVLRADFARAIAEFWADGPDSETPPGHWNTIANAVSDSLTFPRQVAGAGQPVDRLEWDAKLYFAVNGAVHDAAVAAWGLKGAYASARPISMVRYMGGLGQSSEPDGPAYHPDGLPLVPDLVEVITRRSSLPGARHEHLADHVGEVAVRSWRGNPRDPESQTGGVGWILAVDWVPYQQPTFVTPAFAGYVSGHSTFSRAAAEVLTAFTDDPYFPGGAFEWVVPAGTLGFELGPTEDITLQWATYYDAADQAGLSRIYGGIHPSVDDLAGRRLGSLCGLGAWDLAQRYFEGSVVGNV